MASGSATLVLKAAVVAAFFVVLVMPSSAGCKGRQPMPAPAPAPAHGPAPTVKCRDCDSYCDSIWTCSELAQAATVCSQSCGASSCGDCKSNGSKSDEYCEHICSGSSCKACQVSYGDSCWTHCRESCAKRCDSREPVLALAPAPVKKCNDCDSSCDSNCKVEVAIMCTEFCDDTTCGDCKAQPDRSCAEICSGSQCKFCQKATSQCWPLCGANCTHSCV